MVFIPLFQLENLVEMKHHRLARSQRAGQSEKDLKPNAATRFVHFIIIFLVKLPTFVRNLHNAYPSPWNSSIV